MLRAAHWRASRYGLEAELLDPLTGQREPAQTAVETLIAFAREALEHSHDDDQVTDSFQELMARGTGASRQRAAAARGGDLEAVVTDLRKRFDAALR